MDDQPQPQHDLNAPDHDAPTCPTCSGDAPAEDGASEDPLKQVQQTVADEHAQHQQDEEHGHDHSHE